VFTLWASNVKGQIGRTHHCSISATVSTVGKKLPVKSPSTGILVQIRYDNVSKLCYLCHTVPQNVTRICAGRRNPYTVVERLRILSQEINA